MTSAPVSTPLEPERPSQPIWLRWWAAPLAGAIGACGFAPLGLWPLTLLALAWLIEALASARDWRRAARIGWLFGIGHFSLGNTWIATAFTFQAAMPAWLGGIAVVLLSLYLALFPALACALANGVSGKSRVALPLALAGSWVLGEWLRSWVCTGFPWNPIGVVALGSAPRPGLAAIAQWIGTYALGGAIVLLAACWREAIATLRHRPAVALVLAALPVAAMLAPIHGRGGEGTRAFTLVQPNRAQTEMADPARFPAQFQVLADLSRPLQPGTNRLVLWPESGIPDYLRPGYPGWLYQDSTFGGDPAFARARLGATIGPGSLLLTGAEDLAFEGDRVIGARNVVTAIDSAGTIRGSYAKAHLVPYGEYLPMRGLLGPLGLARLVPGSVDFLPGPGPRTIDFGAWGKVGFQVCYEIVFSGQVIDEAHRPDVLFNPSNDGWFGTWGPPQHLAQARLRAIEEGIPILRSTTTGISAVIDADGVVRAAIPHGVAARIDAMVPPAHAPTLFARFGNRIALAWVVVFLSAAMVARARRRS